LTGQSVIAVRGLTRLFGERTALNDLHLDVAQGEVFGLLGHNGAGKTTTIRILNGLLAPTSGSVSVLGLDPTTSGTEIRARTGVLTATPALDGRLTGRENLAFYAELFGIPPARARRRIDFLIQAFDLEARERDPVSTYSRGMHQRLALARAMLHEPDVLFLDEPTNGLDPVAIRIVHLMIRAFRSDGGTVFLCTHNLEEAERLCDHVAILEQGHMIACGTPRELSRRIGGQHIEIEVANGSTEHARCTLQVAAPDAVVHANGQQLQIEGVRRELIPRLVEALTREGIPVFRVSPRAATLEDVYFSLHEVDDE
jgi:ABC-2 type transport system ATP-binding protein